MKNTYIVIGVVVILVVLGFLFAGAYKNSEAPGVYEEEQDLSGMEDTYQSPTQGSMEGTVETDVNVSVTAPAVKEFTVTGKNFAFAPSTIAVKKGDRVKINFKNENGNHDLVIDEFGVRTDVISQGAMDSIEFVADKTGSFEFYCSVGSHRAMGMKGTLRVE